ncbi:type IV secretion system DNA-binding domain-containing protein [Dysgonomonas sp. Marseille-P4677]|uniref:type IV secretory system conjugative DNA transfer family protein n=1 Tax=Dysgonomonas sp. Marseille-P4677 TaxID=2364790 RepID=UPI0019119977|nr:type IV secretory system conjugative DNA transfer family protein [Dysgonomonas sp. Marseille-P4677]MBK5719888.1 type IV secretion system DNA-binding domain-containing protein [Dysgonomonas sp. Marseille-P4677]
MKILLSFIKYIVFAITIFNAFAPAVLFIFLFVGFLFPEYMNENWLYRNLLRFNIGILHAGLYAIYLTSFLIIGFKGFSNNNFLTKLMMSCILMTAFFIIAGMISILSEVASLIVLGILPIVAIVILFFTRKKRKDQTTLIKNEKKQANKQRIAKELVFETTQGKIYLDNPYRAIYIQGGAGSGKSKSVFEPIIAQLVENNYTGLLYDFKSPELSEKVLSAYCTSRNIKSYFVDFKNPYRSNRINPIMPEYLLKSAYALEYATILINNLIPQTIKEHDFFSDNARMVLAGVIWYLRNHYPNYCTLPHVISLLLHTDIDKLITTISEDYEAGGFVASLKQAIDRGAERQAAGVASTLQNALSQLNTRDIFYILSGSDFDLQLNNPNNPKFLCLGNDSTLASTYAPIISLIIGVCVRQMNQPNKQKSIILLDEAPTIYIPNIEQIPATARSNKVSVVFGVQDYSQLADKYGQDKAQVILSNMGNQFYGRTVNEKSAQMICNLFGKHDRIFETKNRGTGTSGEFVHLSSNTNKGISESIQERDRVRVSDITSLEAGQFYGLIAEGYPNEFLNTQFIPQEVKSCYTFQNKTTDEEMTDNYNRIVLEAKSIIE